MKKTFPTGSKSYHEEYVHDSLRCSYCNNLLFVGPWGDYVACPHCGRLLENPFGAYDIDEEERRAAEE